MPSQPHSPEPSDLGEGRFNDIALFLTAVGFNATVAARAVTITPLDPNHKCRWQLAVLSGNYQVMEQDRLLFASYLAGSESARGPVYPPNQRDYLTARRDDLFDREGLLLLGTAHPQDVAESFVRHLASRLYLRGPLVL